METMSVLTNDIQVHWTSIQPLLSIRNEREYDLAVEHMNQLLDEVGDNEEHPLYGLLDTLSTLISAYEEKHYPMPESSGADMLRYLMEERGLKQSDLPEIGSQGVVSEILNGKRELNIRQMRELAKRFHVSPAAFLPLA